MKELISTYEDETGALKFYYDDDNDDNGTGKYLITFKSGGNGIKNEILIYSNPHKETAGRKFFECCTGAALI